MIDTHCHLDSELFAADRDAVLARAQARGVTDIVLPSITAASWEPLLALRRSTAGPRLHVALGLHPVFLLEAQPEEDEPRLAALERLLTAERAAVVGIGECGLDAAIDLGVAPWDRQERLLEAQLELARRLGLPVILHARGHLAYQRLLGVLARTPPLSAGGVVHSYGGGHDLVTKFAAYNLSFGFSGPATYPDARKVRASIVAAPEERLLAETDAPDQTPVPHRPGRSEPSYVADVLVGIAAARGTSVEQMAAVTSVNARRLFRLEG